VDSPGLIGWEAGRDRYVGGSASSYSHRGETPSRRPMGFVKAQAHTRGRRSCDKGGRINRAAAPVAWRPVNSSAEAQPGRICLSSRMLGGCDRSAQGFAGPERRAEVTPRLWIETGYERRGVSFQARERRRRDVKQLPVTHTLGRAHHWGLSNAQTKREATRRCEDRNRELEAVVTRGRAATRHASSAKRAWRR
jgi:hypothetical protein